MTYRKKFSLNYIAGQLKRFWWVSALYFICLFFAIPFRILVNADRWAQRIITAQAQAAELNADVSELFKIDLFNYTQGAECVAFVIVPLLITALIFSYINNKSSVDMMHALPISRKRLYYLNASSGAILYTLPIIAVSAVVCVLISVFGFWPFVGIGEFFQWIASSLISLSFFYVFSIFFAICTGNVPAMVVLTYFFSLLPYSLYTLINLLFSQWFFGMSNVYYSAMELVNHFTPFIRVFMFAGGSTRGFDLFEGSMYIIAVAVILFLGCILYTKRKSEAAGNVLAFKISQPLIKYIITFCGTIIFGTILFMLEGGQNMIILIFGYIIGAALFYMIVQALIYKDVRAIKKGFKSMVVYIAVFLVFTMTLMFDIYGYQKKVPRLDEVKSVYLDSFLVSMPYTVRNRNTDGFTSKENIESIINFHKEILNKKFNKDYNPLKNRTSYTNSDAMFMNMGAGTLEYVKNNGNAITRTYSYDFETLKKHIPSVFASEEGKRYSFLIFHENFKVPDEMTVVSFFDNTSISNKSAGQIEYVISALRQDILDDPTPVEFENTDIALGKVFLRGTMEMDDINKYPYGYEIIIKPYYSKTVAVLKTLGIELKPLDAENISHLEVSIQNAKSYYVDSTALNVEQSSTLRRDTMTISDAKSISEVLSKLKYQPGEFGTYFGNYVRIYITLNNSTVVEGIYTIDNDEIPSFILEYFNIVK